MLMPELPDITAYIAALEPRIVGQPLSTSASRARFCCGQRNRRWPAPKAIPSANCAASANASQSASITAIWLALHLMIAGRLHWRPPQAKLAGRQTLAAFDFPNGSLVLTEAGAKRRASLHVLAGEESLGALDAGGIDVLSADLDSFRAALTAENHTLKRALTDPRLLSGIGNAYSDEILHAAQLSPLALTQKLATGRMGAPLRRHAKHATVLDRSPSR